VRVLVTGDAGFVGRHMRAAFKQRGAEVVGVDLRRGYDAIDFFRSPWFGGIDVAVHCAAYVKGRVGIDNSPLAVATNLALDSWFFRWLQLAQVPRAVYLSSSAVYPTDLQDDLSRPVALTEDMVRWGRAAGIGRPDQTYGWAKLSGEMLAEHARQAGCKLLVVRPFSGYGADQGLEYPFPSFIRRASQLEDPFEIWGDGEQTRDFIHISDVVGAVMAMLDAGDVEEPVNIGSGVGTSFNELAQMVIAARGGGYRPQIKHLAGWPTGVAHRVADTGRMQRFYQPRVSLQAGIRQALHAACGPEPSGDDDAGA
jgi:nucleoside-diphosphate-sugar epimerase